MNKQTKKIIAREFLWTLASFVLFLIIFYLWDSFHNKSLRQIEKIEEEKSKIEQFEPYKSLMALVTYSESADNIDSYIKDNVILSKFDKQVLLDYIATINSGKYSNNREVNSKFPEFGFDKSGLHKNFTEQDLEIYRNHKKDIENIQASFFYSSISGSDIFGLLFVILFFTFGIRYLFFAIKWSIKQLKED